MEQKKKTVILEQRKRNKDIVSHTRKLLKEHASLLKERFDIDVPKNIQNISAENFLNTIICLHYAITRKGFDENEHTVALIVDRLDRSIKILKHTWYPARISQNNI